MLNRQAKILSQSQIRAVLLHLDQTRSPTRNRALFLLSVRAGLRAKEIAELTWGMVTDSDGKLSNVIRLTDDASKGQSGGVIPMARDLQIALQALMDSNGLGTTVRVIRTERSAATTAQVIVNLFGHWYRSLGFNGCSSHSGRRTFITNAARNIGRFGGSLRDVQALARHSSLAMTQTYIEIDTEAMRRVVDA